MKAILGNAFIAIKEYQMKVAPVPGSIALPRSAYSDRASGQILLACPLLEWAEM